MADIKSSEERSKNMSAIKSKDTKPELYLRKGLYLRGFRYRLIPANVPGHPDLYMAKYKLAVFVHGCFWHRHEGCKYAYMPKSREEFWNKKFENNIRRDAEVRQQLYDTGIRCLIVWECAINRSRQKKYSSESLFCEIEKYIFSDQVYGEISIDVLKPVERQDN